MTENNPILPKYSPIIDDYESIAIDFFGNKLDAMLAKIEPVMIDFASKAETDNAQVQFFDSITLIGNRYAVVKKDFIDIIKQGFFHFRSGRSIHYPSPIVEAEDATQLRIVSDQDLEIHLAVQSMITRAKNNNHQALYQMVQRLAILKQGQRPIEAHIPASPAHVATTFQTVVSHFELEQKFLLILFILFEKSVVNGLGTLYGDVNKLLSEAGIYPNLAPMPRSKWHSGLNTEARTQTVEMSARSEKAGQRRERGEPITNKDFIIGQEIFDSILALLTESRRSDPRFSCHPEYLPGGNLDRLKSKPELVAQLDQLTQSEDIDLTVYARTVDDHLPPVERDAVVTNSLKRKIVDQREALYQELDVNTIPTADLDTIELVGMLFEQILDDPDLASLTKTLICHLHTPYLKIAIVDHSFLTEPNHVARRLLNRVVDAGRRWVDEENLQSGIYGAMHKLIHSLMVELKDDISPLDDYYADFEKQLQTLEHRTRILEERTREATQGRDRLEYAKRHAKAVLDGACEGEVFLPEPAIFLNSLWKNYMMLLLLRDPDVEKQAEWGNVLSVIDSVKAINRAASESGQVESIRRLLPGIRKRIEVGLEFLGNVKHPHYQNLLEMIDQRVAENGTLTASSDNGQPTKAWPKGRKRREKLPRLSQADQKLLEQINQTGIGGWFEFEKPDGKTVRVKLSWYSPITNNYMFIDRFGYKAFFLSKGQLLKRLKKGTARNLKTKRFPFVDHALKKIYKLLSES